MFLLSVNFLAIVDIYDRQMEEELKRKQMSSTDTPLETVKVRVPFPNALNSDQQMQDEQEKTAKPFIVLSGGRSALQQ